MAFITVITIHSTAITTVMEGMDMDMEGITEVTTILTLTDTEDMDHITPHSTHPTGTIQAVMTI
jgi:hypothetical protein